MADQLEQQIERALDQVKSGPVAVKAIGSDGPLVLFGAGRLGLITLKGLRQLGIEPVAWADNNPRLHGSVVEGLPVYSATEASANSAKGRRSSSPFTPGRLHCVDSEGRVKCRPTVA
jgi:hypothetical protein